jgi:hypothetical protein
MVAYSERRRLRQLLHDLDHGFTIQDTGYVVANGGRYFSLSDRRQITEQREGKLTTDRREGISVVEQEGRPSVK